MLLLKQARNVILFCLIISLSGCITSEVQEKNIVSDINGISTISFNELNEYYQKGLFHLLYPDNKMEGYEAALEEMIVKQQKVFDFIDLGLHENRSLINDIQRIINEEIIVQFFNDEFLTKYINEASIKNYYEGMSREVIYRQIVLPKFSQVSSANDIELENLISKIINEASTTEFSELASRYSMDEKTAKNGGLMPAINWENSTSNPLNKVIYTLAEGSIQTLENPRAFHIIKVEEVKDIERPPLMEVKSKIEKDLREMYLDRSLEEYSAYKDEMVDELSLEWNEAALDELVEWAKQENFYDKHYKHIIQNEIDNGNNLVILIHSKGEVNLEKYLQLLNDILIPGRSNNISKADHKKFIIDALRTEYVVKQARALGKDENLLIKNTSSEIIREEFARLYNQEMIWSKIPKATEENLRSFYEMTKDSLFYQMPKVTLYTRVFNDLETASAYWNKIEKGEDFETSVNRRYKVKTFIKNKKGEIESYLSSEKPYLGEIAFQLNTGETSGPVEFIHDEEGKRYAIVKSAKKLEEKQLDYYEIKDIEKQFRSYHINKISKKIKGQLKKKHPAVIYNDVLEQNVLSAS